MGSANEPTSYLMLYPIAQPVIYELPHPLKLELASKIQVNTKHLQTSILAACYNGSIPRPLRRHIAWILTHVLPRPTQAGDEALSSNLLCACNIDLILWLLINYNDLLCGQNHEQLLLRTEKLDGKCRVGYGIIVPAACHPDSVSVFQRSVLLDFGWMGSRPDHGEEPKTSFMIPPDGHGGKFHRFGWVDELPILHDYGLLPQTSYRGPFLEWLNCSEELRKALHVLHNEQEVFEDVWKDASKKVGPRTISEERRRHSELSPWRMGDAVFERLLNTRLKTGEEEEPRVVYLSRDLEDEDDGEDHEPYSLNAIVQMLYAQSEPALQVETNDREEDEDRIEDQGEDKVKEAEVVPEAVPESREKHLPETKESDASQS